MGFLTQSYVFILELLGISFVWYRLHVAWVAWQAVCYICLREKSQVCLFKGRFPSSFYVIVSPSCHKERFHLKGDGRVLLF